MVVYTLEQRWKILRHYLENHGNVAEYLRKLRSESGRREAPSAPYVHYIVKNVKETSINQSVKSQKLVIFLKMGPPSNIFFQLVLIS